MPQKQKSSQTFMYQGLEAFQKILYFKMVPRARIELARPLRRGILNPLCLPISPSGQRVFLHKHQKVGGWSRNRTGVSGFAIRGITILLSSQYYTVESSKKTLFFASIVQVDNVSSLKKNYK